MTGQIRRWGRAVGDLPATYGLVFIVAAIAVLGIACGAANPHLGDPKPKPKPGPRAQVVVLDGINVTTINMDVHGRTVPCVIAGSKSRGYGLSVALDCDWDRGSR